MKFELDKFGVEWTEAGTRRTGVVGAAYLPSPHEPVANPFLSLIEHLGHFDWPTEGPGGPTHGGGNGAAMLA